jgi:hypothetical protein
MTVDYSTTAVPDDYRCADCGAHGVKLWRDGMFTITLRCAACACRKAGQPCNVDAEGMSPYGRHRTDQIGNQLCAVPTPDNKSFWGYSSVPDDGVSWWKRLPNT